MLEWAFTSGILVIMILLIRQLFKGRISLRLQYGLWLLVMVRLLVPVNLFDTDVSVLNLLPGQQEADALPVRAEVGMGGAALQTGAGAQPDDGQKHDMTHVSSQGALEDGRLAVGEREGLAQPAAADTGESAGLFRLLRAIWITGVLAAAAVLGGINLHFFRRLRRARKPLESEGCLPVYVVRGIPSPCLFGLIHPAVYLPEGITAEQLPYVLAHEESHYRAGDHIWALARSLCLALHWYHPLVWVAAYVSRQDGELACDERTIRRLGEGCRNTYGKILVDMTVERVSAADFLCCATTMTTDGRSLKERVWLIAHKPHMLAATGAAVAALLIAVSCVACTGARQESDDTAPETVEDDGEEALGTAGESREETGEEEAGSGSQSGIIDVTDPSVEHILSDRVYYRVPESALIDEPCFTMEIPESLVGEIAYGVVLGENEAGEAYLRSLTFFHIDSVGDNIAIGEEQDVPQYTWQELYGFGALCSYFWTGFPDMGEDLEEIAYRSGTWDIREMEFILANDYDWYAGIGGRLVCANEAGTGAYFYTEPTDVQFDPENPEQYMACAEALAECNSSFSARCFPYEELEEYPGDSGIPQWRQDFEAAEEAYSWFTDIGEIPMKLTGSDMGSQGYETPDGLLYGVVDVPGIGSMEELRGYLSRYFAPELVDALMSGQKPGFGDKGETPFMERDGVLYALSGAVTQDSYIPDSRQYAAYFTEAENGGLRGAWIYMECEYSTVGSDMRDILFYTMEEQEDGSWRITRDFELPVHVMMYAAGDYPAAEEVRDKMEGFLAITLQR